MAEINAEQRRSLETQVSLRAQGYEVQPDEQSQSFAARLRDIALGMKMVLGDVEPEIELSHGEIARFFTHLSYYDAIRNEAAIAARRSATGNIPGGNVQDG